MKFIKHHKDTIIQLLIFIGIANLATGYVALGLAILLSFALLIMLKQDDINIEANVERVRAETLSNAKRLFEVSDKKSMPQVLAKHYSAYLKSARWSTLRQTVIDRDNGQCQHCSEQSNLQVHHKTYGGCFDNFNFNPNQLITLCATCHNFEHNR